MYQPSYFNHYVPLNDPDEKAEILSKNTIRDPHHMKSLNSFCCGWGDQVRTGAIWDMGVGGGHGYVTFNVNEK